METSRGLGRIGRMLIRNVSRGNRFPNPYLVAATQPKQHPSNTPPPPPLYHSRRAPGLPHFFHFTDQEQDMLSGLNNYRGDLEKKRAAEAKANNGIGCLLK
ncbi:hypothetical protein Vafri_5542 [Volvox africanus]|uniref:Uncharacterized protein n=1 Tax=Volvox africanus TaxID=51714 RepID=A0A8J4AW53_9CHLO|nr:hypothetical protein Vafri_5542 [Volvox africanus]